MPQAPAQVVRVADGAQFLVATVFVDEQRHFARDVHGKAVQQFRACGAALAGGAVGQLEQVQAAMQVQHPCAFAVGAAHVEEALLVEQFGEAVRGVLHGPR
ncbi:hypothetical protein D3C85_1569920 [compost metagenome]